MASVKNNKWAYLQDKTGRYIQGRYFGCISYCDFDTVTSFLDGYKVNYVISPLHNADKYIDGEHAGEFKKAHYHVVLWSTVAISPRGYFSMIDNDLGVLVGLERIVDISAYLHYLLHEGLNYDITGKAPYQYKDFYTNNPHICDISVYFVLGETETNIFALCELFENNSIMTFRQAVYFLKETDNGNYIKIFFKNAGFWRGFFQG